MLLDSPMLCGCSRQRLPYILEQVLPRRDLEVKREHTAMDSCGECSFLVILR
ncbi:MAG: hypothetical protein HFE91_00520 [Acutalibacter sp.]|uniref:hypothetical protein n=1 Tax=Acutalibacter sp. TaxID=1918636 RepID=UPI002172E61E|nr:hypothetical protein [Acutalibacter sp.]MCI9223932.1 hypothetical protein [Acutalibacter sp.]